MVARVMVVAVVALGRWADGFASGAAKPCATHPPSSMLRLVPCPEKINSPADDIALPSVLIAA